MVTVLFEKGIHMSTPQTASSPIEEPDVPPTTQYPTDQVPPTQQTPTDQNAAPQGPDAPPVFTQHADGAGTSPSSHAYDPHGGMPQWDQPPYTGAAYTPRPGWNTVERLRNNSVICLVLGILSFVGFGPLTGIPAWIWGHSIINEARSLGIGDDVVSNAKIGKILGIVSTVIFIGLILISVFFLVIMFGLIAASASQGFVL